MPAALLRIRNPIRSNAAGIELAEDLAEFLPGLGAEGYELLEGALVLPSFIEAVADGTVNLIDEAYWRTGLKPSISQEEA